MGLGTNFEVSGGPGVGAITNFGAFEGYFTREDCPSSIFIVAFDSYVPFSATLETPRLLSIHFHFKNHVLTH